MIGLIEVSPDVDDWAVGRLAELRERGEDAKAVLMCEQGKVTSVFVRRENGHLESVMTEGAEGA